MKNKHRILFGALIFILGLIGVLSLLTMDITLPEEAAKILSDKFTPTQIKLLILVNPIILLLISVLLGTLFHDKVKLDSPIVKSLITNEKNYEIASILKYGIFGGLISGAFITSFSLLSAPYLPSEIVELSENIDVTLANRFLYGGITEEILVRFGLMTFLMWLLSRIFKTFTPKIYWIGILLSSIIFGFGHFPIAFQAVAEPSMLLLLYILIGNSIGGIVFGWLYWKKGLESAMIAHIFTHIVMVLASFL